MHDIVFFLWGRHWHILWVSLALLSVFPHFQPFFLFPQNTSSSACVCVFYPFFRSQRQPCQHLMLQTNIETKKRANVCCWSCSIIRSPLLTLGCLCELGEPSNVPRNPQRVSVKRHITVCVCVHWHKMCVQVYIWMCLCTCVYVVSPFNYTIYLAVWITSGFKLKITKPQGDRKAAQPNRPQGERHTYKHTLTQSSTGQSVFSTNNINFFYKRAFPNGVGVYLLDLSSNYLDFKLNPFTFKY